MAEYSTKTDDTFWHLIDLDPKHTGGVSVQDAASHCMQVAQPTVEVYRLMSVGLIDECCVPAECRTSRSS